MVAARTHRSAVREGDYDVARVQFRVPKEHADASTAQLAPPMLQSHWGE
jgi:hypothetical protein